MSIFSKTIRELRKSEQLTQQQLAVLVGSKRSYIAAIEAGNLMPSDVFIHSLCLTFGVSEKWLRTGEEPMRPDVKGKVKNRLLEIYFSIAAELSPSMDVLDYFDYLLRTHIDYNRMINYISYRYLSEKDGNVSKRMAALFSIAFPDYIETTDKLFASVSDARKNEVRSPILLKNININPAGKAAAGPALFDNDSDEIRILLPEKYLNTDRYKYIEVTGDSMEPYIYSGDYVVVAIDVMPDQGGLALVYTSDGQGDDGYLVKLYRSNGGNVQLLSYNDELYPPIILPKSKIARVEKIVFIARAQM